MQYFFLLAVLLLCSATYLPTSEASNRQPKKKVIAGVPVYNYDRKEKLGTRWNVVLKDTLGAQSQDYVIKELCKGNGMCVARGHPVRGGLPFATLQGDEVEVTKFIAKFQETMFLDAFEFVEPDLEVYVNSTEDGSQEGFHVQGPACTKWETTGWHMGRYEQAYPPGLAPNGQQWTWQQCAEKCGEFARCEFWTLQLTEDKQCLMMSGKGEYKDVPPDHVEGPRLSGCKACGEQPGPYSCAPTPAPPPAPAPIPCDERGPLVRSPTDFWGLDRIDQRKGRDGQYGACLDGHGVHVYVMDTGINTNHQDFEGRAIPTIETHEGTLVDCAKGPRPYNDCAQDANGHGSHCAGSVGGKQSGVAKKVTIHACKIMAGRTGYTSRIAMGIDWVAMNALHPALMSMSIGADGTSETMRMVIRKAAERNIASVVAAGNRAKSSCTQTPAHVKEAIVVSATDENDRRARYSNYGDCTDIWAPGDRIKSVSHSSNTAFKTMSGTSMATPHVAGAAALMLQVNKDLSPAEIEASLKSYGTPGLIYGANTAPNLLLYVTRYSGRNPTARRRRQDAPRRRRSESEERRRRRSGIDENRRRSGNEERRRRSRLTPSVRRRRAKTRRRRAKTRRRRAETRRRRRTSAGP